MAGKTSKAGAKAKGMAKGAGKAMKGETGILRHLAEEHGEVSALMKRVARTAESSKLREELFPEIRRNLLAHAKAEEREFYPALEKDPDLAALVDQSLDEHREVEGMLEELASKNKATKTWLTSFKKMMRAVEAHVDLEEHEVFPLAAELLSDAQRDSLLHRYEKEEKALKQRLG